MTDPHKPLRVFIDKVHKDQEKSHIYSSALFSGAIDILPGIPVVRGHDVEWAESLSDLGETLDNLMREYFPHLDRAVLQSHVLAAHLVPMDHAVYQKAVEQITASGCHWDADKAIHSAFYAGAIVAEKICGDEPTAAHLSCIQHPQSAPLIRAAYQSLEKLNSNVFSGLADTRMAPSAESVERALFVLAATQSPLEKPMAIAFSSYTKHRSFDALLRGMETYAHPAGTDAFALYQRLWNTRVVTKSARKPDVIMETARKRAQLFADEPAYEAIKDELAATWLVCGRELLAKGQGAIALSHAQLVLNDPQSPAPFTENAAALTVSAATAILHDAVERVENPVRAIANAGPSAMTQKAQALIQGIEKVKPYCRPANGWDPA